MKDSNNWSSATSSEWSSLIAGFEKLDHLAERLSDPQDKQGRYELYRTIYAGAAQAYFGLLYADAEHPDFYPAFSNALNFMGPNPDNVYYMTPIDDKGIYKISGFRGSVRIVDFNLGSGMLLVSGTGKFGATKANYDLDQNAHIGKDGAFEVIISAERPAGHGGDWWQLVPGTTVLFLRQVAYDWLNEVDARIAIERLDRPAIKPRPTAARLEENMKLVSEWSKNWIDFDFDWQKQLVDQGLVNAVTSRDITATGGLINQWYIEGTFDLQPDEALIVEAEIPECHYWNMQLTDEKFVALDMMNRQTSLNGHTARIDGDGKFRAVISAQDPGVPNWLDTAGYQKGEILGRWKDAASNPNPKVSKVGFADVRRHLPADTPVVTAAVRDAAIRLRRKGHQLRRRW